MGSPLCLHRDGADSDVFDRGKCLIKTEFQICKKYINIAVCRRCAGEIKEK